MKPLIKTFSNFCLLFIVLVIIYNLSQPESIPNTETKIASKITESTPIVSKAWEPVPFELKGASLPPYYSGLDAEKFFDLFENKIEQLNSYNIKGQYETSVEFEKRKKNKDEILAPLSTSTLYAFHLIDIPKSYDADNQIYTIGDYLFTYTDRCKRTNKYEDKDKEDYLLCLVQSIYSKDDTYIGNNAFGVSVEIKRTWRHNFSLALKNNPQYYSYFNCNRKYGGDCSYQDKIFVPLEKARSLSTESIEIIFVGKISDAKIIKAESQLQKPTIDKPEDIFIYGDAVPFTLKKIYYYVLSTGEILGQRDFTEPH